MNSITDLISTGEDNAVSLAELCQITGLESRALRLLIEAARRNGAVICSSVNGYFFPETLLELQDYIHRERARSKSITRSLKAAEKLLKDWKEQNDE